MQNADHYNDLLSQALEIADELQAILPQTRPDKTMLQGSKGVRRAGNGLEFIEFREFDEDIHESTQIDARISAAKGANFVRQTEDEALVHCLLWRATGPSMDFSSRPAPKPVTAQVPEAPHEKQSWWRKIPFLNNKGAITKHFNNEAGQPARYFRTKQEASDLLLLTAARLLLSQTQSNQVTLLNGTGGKYSSRQQLSSLAFDLQQTQAPSQIGQLSEYAGTFRNRAHVIMFSDCLRFDIDPAELNQFLAPEKDPGKRDRLFAEYYVRAMMKDIETMHAHNMTGHLVHIFDMIEWDFPFTDGRLGGGRTEFEFAGDSMIAPNAAAMRGDYLRRMAALQTALREALENIGWGYSVYVTDRPLSAGLMPLLGVEDAALSLKEEEAARAQQKTGSTGSPSWLRRLFGNPHTPAPV